MVGQVGVDDELADDALIEEVSEEAHVTFVRLLSWVLRIGREARMARTLDCGSM